MIKYKRSAQDAVHDVLATLKGGIALTSKEIYNELEPADQGLFVGGVDGVMKSINKLHTRGLVVNGNSEVVNGRMVKTWRLKDEVSTNKSMVISIPEAVESETVEETVEETVKETVEVCQTEAEFSFTAVKADTINSLIDEASCTAQMAIKSIMLSLQDKVDEISIKESGKTNVDPLIDGLMEVSDLLSEKIAVKHVIPAVEFLRGLK
jgi:hypothetical protein